MPIQEADVPFPWLRLDDPRDTAGAQALKSMTSFTLALRDVLVESESPHQP